MRGMDIFQKPYYREISTMRGRPMRRPPVSGQRVENASIEKCTQLPYIFE